MKIYLIPTFYKKRTALPLQLFFFYIIILPYIKRTLADTSGHFRNICKIFFYNYPNRMSNKSFLLFLSSLDRS